MIYIPLDNQSVFGIQPGESGLARITNDGNRNLSGCCVMCVHLQLQGCVFVFIREMLAGEWDKERACLCVCCKISK